MLRRSTFLAGAALLGALLLVPAAMAAPAVTVTAGPALQKPPPGISKQADVPALLPSTVTVRAGQSVRWQFYGFHTVTFTGGKAAPVLFTPVKGKTESATSDASGAAFWWGGTAPAISFNPVLLAPQKGGTVTGGKLVTSDLVRIFQSTNTKPPIPYDVVFPKPGVYRYICAVHPAMRGVVRVVPSGKTTSPAQAKAAASAQLNRALTALRKLQAKNPTSGPVSVGVSDQAAGAQLLSMGPKRLNVKVGETVVFRNDSVFDPHTVTFGPEKLRSTIEKDFAGPKGLDPLGAYPSEKPGTAQPIAYDGTNHGNGYLNSGVLVPKGSPKAAGPQSFSVKFTKAGTYDYECVIHPKMDGEVVVS